jgi:hypothetical protein
MEKSIIPNAGYALLNRYRCDTATIGRPRRGATTISPFVIRHCPRSANGEHFITGKHPREVAAARAAGHRCCLRRSAYAQQHPSCEHHRCFSACLFHSSNRLNCFCCASAFILHRAKAFAMCLSTNRRALPYAALAPSSNAR